MIIGYLDPWGRVSRILWPRVARMPFEVRHRMFGTIQGGLCLLC